MGTKVAQIRGMNFIKSIAFICALLFGVLAFAGPGEPGGGGTIVLGQKRPELLDLALFKKQHPGFQEPLLGAGIQLPGTRALQCLHIEKIENDRLSPLQLALERIALWSDPPPLIRILKRSLESAPIYYMDYRFTRTDGNYWIPENLKNEFPITNLRVISYYTKDFGMIMSKPDFESLDLLNQTALLIHESLRHLQFTYQIQISNEDTEAATAAIVYGLPNLLAANVANLGTENEDILKNTIENYNLLIPRACSFMHRYLPNDREVMQGICLSPALHEKTDLKEFEKHVGILKPQLQRALDDIFPIRNNLPISVYATLLDLRNEIYLLDLQYALHSVELEEALEVLRDATIKSNHFLFDAKITQVDQGWSCTDGQDLKSLFENEYGRGLLTR